MSGEVPLDDTSAWSGGDGVPEGELALFDASGHVPFPEQPVLFRATVADVIDRHS